jgi:uncharacterized protein YdaU (DUF1376 family)
MMKKQDHWMPLYIGDYLADTTHLTPAQHGAYMLLLMYYWVNGPPPDEDEVLCQITRANPAEWQKCIKDTVSKFFRIENRLWLHKRVEIEKARAEHLCRVRKAAGQSGGIKSASKRQAKHQANAKQTGQQNPTPSPSPSPSPSSDGVTEDVAPPLGVANVTDETPKRIPPMTRADALKRQATLEAKRIADAKDRGWVASG